MGVEDHEDGRGIWLARWMIDATRDEDGSPNLVGALMLAQVTYWSADAWRDGRPRARHEHHGKHWLVRGDHEWTDDLGISTRTAGKHRRRLVELGLVECSTLKDDGRPITHLRRLFSDADSAEIADSDSAKDGTATGSDSAQVAESSSLSRDLPTTRELAAVAAAPLVSWKVPKIVVDGGRLAEAVELCDLMAKLLRDRGHRVAAETSRSKGWVGPMEALLRLDGRIPEDVARVLRWLDRGGDDVASFWRVNVLSPDKLRLQWDRMREQYERAVGPRPSRSSAVLGAGHGPDLADVLRPGARQEIHEVEGRESHG